MKFFITGTDTGCGKTSITRLLIRTFHKQNKQVLALKPIASGQNQQGYNEDAYLLAKAILDPCESGAGGEDFFLPSPSCGRGAGGEDFFLPSPSCGRGAGGEDSFLPSPTCGRGVGGEGVSVTPNLLIKTINQINPICFKPPIAPSIAANLEGRMLTAQTVWDACQPALKTPADVVLVEGVGGFCVPLNNQETCADLAKKFNFPVILVVGLRLGCLNHAILTYQAILQANLQIAGWVANHIDPTMEMVAENIETLKQFLKAPYLGFVPFNTVEASAHIGKKALEILANTT
jgi:dethiobiotin synthase